MSEFKMHRIGLIMEPEKGNPFEEDGVLNPAVIRGHDGELYLFPRLVAKGNFSRIGICKVKFDEKGDPTGVERMGIALEPEMDYELRPDGGGCEDPRITYVEPLKHYIMTYTAFGPDGPRIALAKSDDLLHWERLGLATFTPFEDIEFNNVANKDAALFPVVIPSPDSNKRIALIHRPLFPGSIPEDTIKKTKADQNRNVDLPHESIWISYCPMDAIEDDDQSTSFTDHYRLASPVESWEKLKIGGGAPPILTRHGWLLIYHGVSEHTVQGNCEMIYSAGVMVLSRTNPHHIKYRSPEPILTPETDHEMNGIVQNVVFPTGIDRRDDLGSLDRIDIYYGMADMSIGVAQMIIPKELPKRSAKDAPHSEVAGKCSE